MKQAWRREVHTTFLSENLKKKEHLGDPGINERTIL
jgi:hypothetical protein